MQRPPYTLLTPVQRGFRPEVLQSQLLGHQRTNHPAEAGGLTPWGLRRFLEWTCSCLAF